MPETSRGAGSRLTHPPALSEIADFLRAHAPFDTLAAADLDRVVDSAEIEFHAAGTTIFSRGAEPVRHLRVVRSGAVEIVLDDRVLDRLESGELFGHASMLSGLPTGFTARAAEDTLCYRIPAAVAQDLLSRPEGLRYITRSLLVMPMLTADDPLPVALDAAHRPVGALIRGAPVVCRPDTPIRTAAQLMSAAAQTAVVVDLGGGAHGILTDHDLRTRVVAEGMTGDAPVSAAMTAPAYTCGPDRLAGDVLLDMLDRGLRHYPVVAATGEVLGVVGDFDLVAVETRSSFHLRREIARAGSVDELVGSAQELPRLLIALHEAKVAATNISTIHTVVLDALTRRLLELAIAARGGQAPSFAWLALGSQARRETVPGSDADSAIVWFDDDADEEETRPYLVGIGEEVTAGLEACGVPRDVHRATAADPLVVRSQESWRRAARSWLEHPTQEQALILVSVFVDSRPVWGIHLGSPLADTFRGATRSEGLLRLLARLAVAHRPPTGFLRGLVVEHSGEHRGLLDLKNGGLVPITDLARWAGLAAGVTSASTRERLAVARDAATLSASDVQTLEDAFELISELRLEHQIRQLRRGIAPDDHVDPAMLSALMRTQLKDAFRAIASIQKGVSASLTLGVL